MLSNLVATGASTAYLYAVQSVQETAIQAGGNATVEAVGNTTATIAAAAAAAAATERDAVTLLCAICVVGTIVEILAWVWFFFSMVESRRKWFFNGLTRREYILGVWNKKFLGGKVPSLGGWTISLDYYRA